MGSIQYISIKKRDINNIDCYSFKNCRTFDTYPTNIIDLSDSEVWTYSYSNSLDSVNCADSLVKLNSYIKETKSKVVVILPQNENIFIGNRVNPVQIGQNLDSFNRILETHFDFIKQNNIKVEYSPSLVRLATYDVQSDFVFTHGSEGSTFFETNGSLKKCSLLINNNIVITTMELDSYIDFVNFIGRIPDSVVISIPQWANDYNILNDEELINRKNELIKDIKKANSEISEINAKVLHNTEIKSCLWKTGDDLVSAVFPLVEKIYDCDLSTFVDEKKADFIFTKSTITVVGEIKGVKSNVNRTHIAKAEAHKQEYIQELKDSGTPYNEDNILCVLIINYELDRPVTERDDVNQEVIDYAKHQKVLIIDTATLINLYESKIKGKDSNLFIKELNDKMSNGIYIK